MSFSNLHRNQELVDKLSKLKLASINYPDKASLQPEPDNRRAGHSPALRILGAVTQTSPRDFSTGSLDSVRCTKLVSPETADATKLVKLESESKQQRTILSSTAPHKVDNREVIDVTEEEERKNKNKTITGISTSEKVPSPKASSRLKSKDVILVHKRVAVLRRSEPKYKNRPTKQTCPVNPSIMKIIPASTALHKVGTREVPIDVDKWAEEFERKNKNTEINEQLNLEIILKAKPQWRAQGRCSTMMCMHPATNSWTPVPVDFSFTFVFTVTAARAVAIGIHIPKVRPALRSDMARHPVHPPPSPQPQLPPPPPPPPPPCSSRPVPLVSAPPLAQSQNISVVSLPPKAKPGHSFQHWRSPPPIIDDEADVAQVTVRPALQAGMVCRPIHPQPQPQFPPPPRSSRPVQLVSAPPPAQSQSQKVSVVSPPRMAMAKLEPSFRHWRSAPPIIIDDDEADDSTNHNPKFNAAKHGVHEQDDSAMDVDSDSANTDSRSDWRVSALAILLRQLSVEEGSSAIPFPYGIGIPAQRPAGTAAGSVPASSGHGPDASSGSSDSTSGSTSGFGSGSGSWTGTGAPSVPVSSAPGARPPFSWAGGRVTWRLDEIVTKLTYWS